jgi:trehalose/maltose transport system permease protein
MADTVAAASAARRARRRRGPAHLRQPLPLKLVSGAFLGLWCVIAAFPIFWIAVMSFKSPVDAFDGNALNVIFGPETLAQGKGVSFLDLVLAGLAVWGLARVATRSVPDLVRRLTRPGWVWLGWIAAGAGLGMGAVALLFGVLPVLAGLLNPVFGPLGRDIIGFTTEHYYTVWVERGFIDNFWNSLIVTAGVVSVSLTVGTLAGYGLARSGSALAFWILIVALIFRALPHSVLVAGYLPVFINVRGMAAPDPGRECAHALWPALGGDRGAGGHQPAVHDLDAALVLPEHPGRTGRGRPGGRVQPFPGLRRVIMPVMWPGVITTGLFSFLLAYNDFLVTSLLLDAQNQTMVPAITQYVQPRDHDDRPDRGGRRGGVDHRAAVRAGDGVPEARSSAG